MTIDWDDLSRQAKADREKEHYAFEDMSLEEQAEAARGNGAESRTRTKSRKGRQPRAPRGPVEDGPHLTDEGNARRMVVLHGADLRHCQPWHKWLVWDGRRWRLDDTFHATRHAKDVAADLLRQARALRDSLGKPDVVQS